MGEILITGGAGFVGLNTARAFASAGMPVVVTARQMNGRIEKAIDEFRDLITIEPVNLARNAEVFDLFSRYRFRGVIHSAQAHQHAQTRVANRANYDMIFNCLEAAEATGVRRLLLVGSMAVYVGLAPPFLEDKRFPVQASIDDSPEALFTMTGPDGKRHLGAPAFEVTVKRALEQIVLDYATPMQMGLSARSYPNQKFNENQLDVAILRLPLQFGPGYSYMGNPISLAAHTLAGKGDLVSGTGYGGMPVPLLWNSIAQAPLVYVRDTASALVRMMQIDTLPHRIYNMSSGYTTSPREQLQAFYRIRPDAERLLKINPKALRNDPYPTLGLNADLLTKDTGWSSGYSFEEALQDYIEWLQVHPY